MKDKFNLTDCPKCGKQMEKLGSYNYTHFVCSKCDISMSVPIDLLEGKK
jgi:endogenous inhibitor of DNA gyrase (YacG/DUF329 family)